MEKQRSNFFLLNIDWLCKPRPQMFLKKISPLWFSPGWPQICHVEQTDFEPLILFLYTVKRKTWTQLLKHLTLQQFSPILLFFLSWVHTVLSPLKGSETFTSKSHKDQLTHNRLHMLWLPFLSTFHWCSPTCTYRSTGSHLCIGILESCLLGQVLTGYQRCLT